MRRTLSTRRGFTLVELLVVIGVSLALAALAAGVGYSGMIGSQRTVSSADRVSGWLILAKQRALRDLRPNGVRFIGKPVNPTQPASGTNPLVFSEAQYIEQPGAYVPGAASSTTSGSLPPPSLLVVRPVSTPSNPTADVPQLQLYFASQSSADISEFEQRVREGDRIRLSGLLDASYPIFGDNPTEVANPVSGDPTFNAPGYRFLRIPISDDSKIDLSRRLAAGFSPATTNSTVVFSGARSGYAGTGSGFGFTSQPQPVLGEPILQITDPMAIDARFSGAFSDAASRTATSTTSGVDLRLDPLSTTANYIYYFDVLFNPSGSLVGSTDALVCLWIRNKDTLRDEVGATANPRDNFDKAGQQLLVVVSPRTGLISTQPVNDDATNPYLFATDGKNNGV